MRYLPNWLIVYGTNRNAGKTTLVTDIIRHFHRQLSITAIKISPHFHPLDDKALVLNKTGEYVIVRETTGNTGKDSSRMLDAGADEALYIQVWDDHLEQAIPEILTLIKPGNAVICESGWARSLISPGAFLILNRTGNKEIKDSVPALRPLADRWIEFDGTNFDFSPAELTFEEGWKFK